MTGVNLRPIQKDDRPTSHVRVGQSKIGGETDVVCVRHRGREAYFRAETEDDRVMDNVGSRAYIHENVADIYGGVSYDEPFYVDADASKASVPAANEVTIYPNEVATDALAEFLRETEFFVHRIEEVAEIRGSLVRFTVNDMAPDAYGTLRVTEETDLTFEDEPATPEPASRAGGRGGHDGAGGAGGAGRGPADGDDDGATVSVDPTVPQVNFEDDVAGLDEVKQTARMLLALFDQDVHEQVVEMYGEEFADRGGSMLLYGPPGCGKTHVSEAIAYEAKYNAGIEEQYGEVTFLEVRGSDIQSKYAGESEKNVRAVFERAHSIAQDGFAVLFFDEIETLIPDRSDDNLQRHERAVTNAVLQEMNDVEDNLFVIGATNMPFNIDPAASRRFPIQQFIPQPDEDVMAEVWRKQLSSLPNAERIDFERLGAESVGYTPAEVADRILGSDLQRELITSVVEGDPQEVTTEYLLEQVAETEPKTIRQFITSVRNQVDELEGYPQLRSYVHEQADQLGIPLDGANNNTLGDLFAGSSEAAATDDDDDAAPTGDARDGPTGDAGNGPTGDGAAAPGEHDDTRSPGDR
ncbi:ATP-binding protein [Haloparvum sp. PAK95]|uniref:ATP-binding protein n=1 Tax=Haloparvum sp. PAK95 TaxID=3418962 RepID=UPI003D2F328F